MYYGFAREFATWRWSLEPWDCARTSMRGHIVLSVRDVGVVADCWPSLFGAGRGAPCLFPACRLQDNTTVSTAYAKTIHIPSFTFLLRTTSLYPPSPPRSPIRLPGAPKMRLAVHALQPEG